MTVEDCVCGRVMRLPLFDGQVPAAGPVHLVADSGEEYLLIASPSSRPGKVEDLAAAEAGYYEPHLDQDRCVNGDVLGSIIWRAKILEGA